MLPNILTYDDLAELRLTRHQLDGMLTAGEYERVAPGTFHRVGLVDDTTVALMAVARRKPLATLCLVTALSLYDLTDEIPSRTDVAIPRGSHPSTVFNTPIAWHSFDRATFAIGRREHPLSDGLSIGIYSPERTIVDLFRLRHSLGSDLAIASLRRWLGREGSSPATILDLARSFKGARASLQSALEILL